MKKLKSLYLIRFEDETELVLKAKDARAAYKKAAKQKTNSTPSEIYPVPFYE